MAEIITTNGLIVLVDDEDYDALNVFRWQSSRVETSLRSSYAFRTHRIDGKPSTIYMHRSIMNAPKGVTVDHINHNRLDNRRANLRLVTALESTWNRPITKKNTTGYRGVYPSAKKFAVRIYIEGKMRQFGTFASAVDAAKAYDELILNQRGEYAILNFPGGAG